MKSLLFVLLLCLISFQGISQTTKPHIEIAVEETIELKVKSATVGLIVQSIYKQMESQFYIYDYYEDEFYYEEEDYYYEQMMEDSPKKVTKEMKKAYKERQENKEARELEYEQLMLEQEKRRDAFVPYTAKDLIQHLNESKISFNVITDITNGMRDFYEDAYHRRGVYSIDTDTIIIVSITEESEFNDINGVIYDIPVESSIIKVNYETLEDHYTTALPKLTEKAKNQATILASSLGKKVGDVLKCSNVNPQLSTSIDFDTEYETYEEDEWERYSEPFSHKNTKILQYTYQFELL